MGHKNGGRKKGVPNVRRYQSQCEWCGKMFPHSRPEALTCSNAHRLRWARWCREVAKRGKGTAVVGPRGDLNKQYFLSGALLRK